MRSKSSAKWLQRQHNDVFTERSKKEGYRSRAAYKLLEIQKKDNLIRQGMCVVDLGAAPGSWSQIASNLVGSKGTIFALDLLPIMPLKNVEFIQGDFNSLDTLEILLKKINNQTVDLVISDIAPNLSGIPAVDQPRLFHLAELVLDFAYKVLRKEGNLLIKVFQGEGFEEYHKLLKNCFKQVSSRKPVASRSESRELYLLAKSFAP